VKWRLQHVRDGRHEYWVACAPLVGRNGEVDVVALFIRRQINHQRPRGFSCWDSTRTPLEPSKLRVFRRNLKASKLVRRADWCRLHTSLMTAVPC